MKKKELAKEIKSAVKWLQEEEAGCVVINLDGLLGVCVGWLDGYDDNDSTCIHSRKGPSWGINAGVKVLTSDDLQTDYEFLNAPYFDSGDVWSTDCTISPDEDYVALAEYLLKEYKAMSYFEIEFDGRILDVASPDELADVI